MNTTTKYEWPAVMSRDARRLDDLLDQALADSFPASDPVAIDFASPGDEVTSRNTDHGSDCVAGHKGRAGGARCGRFRNARGRGL